MSNIIITGIGTINSVSGNVSEFKEALFNMDCGIRYQPESETYFAALKELDFDSYINKYSNLLPEKCKLAKKLLHRKSYEIKAGVLAVFEAAVLSGIMNITDRRRISVIVAGSNLFQELSYDTYKKYSDRIDFITPKYALQYMDTHAMSLISEIFDIHGEGFTIGGASASGNVAIVKAKQLIDLDISDACVIVGLPTLLSPMELYAFKNLDSLGGKNTDLEPNKVCRPFDNMHDGFIPAQAASCIIIEKENIKNYSQSFGELCSAVMYIDGNSSSKPSYTGEVDTMKYAIEKAGITASQIDYINAHGTSTPLGDKTELSAIGTIFGDKPIINSSKSIIGHCLNSAGISEAISVVLQLQNNFIHGNRNLIDPINNNVSLARNTVIFDKLNYALSNSFGFGGINSSIVIKKQA